VGPKFVTKRRRTTAAVTSPAGPKVNHENVPNWDDPSQTVAVACSAVNNGTRMRPIAFRDLTVIC